MYIKTQQLVNAVWLDARQTWPEVDQQWMFEEAELLLVGGKAHGGPFIMLHDALQRAGMIS